MVRVLYVMGLYRSGSTILDIVLANHPELVGVGELRNLPLSGWDHTERCACGEPVDHCVFWHAVRTTWESRAGPAGVPRLAVLQNRFERIRSLPRLLAQGIVGRSRAFEEYCELLEGLYDAIALVSGRPVIVDSTKYPARALALLRAPGIDLRLIHLVRDGRAVIWSMRRKQSTELEVAPERIARHTTRQWLLTNLTGGLVAKMAGAAAIRVRYEDFVSNPGHELDRIGRLVGIATAELAQRVSNGENLDIGHTVAGNRVRMGGPVRLKADVEWRAKLPEAERATFWRMAGWLAKQYGYSRV